MPARPDWDINSNSASNGAANAALMIPAKDSDDKKDTGNSAAKLLPSFCKLWRDATINPLPRNHQLQTRWSLDLFVNRACMNRGAFQYSIRSRSTKGSALTNDLVKLTSFTLP